MISSDKRKVPGKKQLTGSNGSRLTTTGIKTGASDVTDAVSRRMIDTGVNYALVLLHEGAIQ